MATLIMKDTSYQDKSINVVQKIQNQVVPKVCIPPSSNNTISFTDRPKSCNQARAIHKTPDCASTDRSIALIRSLRYSNFHLRKSAKRQTLNNFLKKSHEICIQDSNADKQEEILPLNVKSFNIIAKKPVKSEKILYRKLEYAEKDKASVSRKEFSKKKEEMRLKTNCINFGQSQSLKPSRISQVRKALRSRMGTRPINSTIEKSNFTIKGKSPLLISSFKKISLY